MIEEGASSNGETLGLAELSPRLSRLRGLVHVTSVQGTALAIVAADLARRRAPLLVVVADGDDVNALSDDLSAWAPDLRVGLLPAPESTPFDGVRPDRRVSLLRVAAASRLDHGELDVLITSAAGLLRKLVPSSLSLQVELDFAPGQTLNPSELARRLDAGGYQRAAVVEDPGTFAIRGSLIDLWPPGEPLPLRLELDFERLATIAAFDPETQRKQEGSERLTLRATAAREAIVTESSGERARQRVQELCDAINYPSSKARALLHDVQVGHLFLGGDAFLPAYAQLESLWQRLDADCPVLVAAPSQVVEALRAERTRHELAWGLRHDEPVFPVDEYLANLSEVEAFLLAGERLVVACHSGRVYGDMTGLDALAAPPLDALNVDSTHQLELVRRLESARKSAGKNAGLDPLVEELHRWLEEPWGVVLSARSKPQSERLATLLQHRGLRVAAENSLTAARGELSIVTSSLASGAILPSLGLVLLTEEEIFGKRRHKSERRSSTRSLKNALDDLRSLQPGDLVVHVEHGVGRYLGLEHKQLPAGAVDLLVVEYQGGDKLFLPVYRLNQIQKLQAGEGSERVDRLGGQTFAKTKQRVRQKVRELADQLLGLYAERAGIKRPPLAPPGDDFAAFEAAFPYEETADQAAAIADVLDDLQKDTVMDRLVCGDVGFGKTEVALRAAYLAVLGGRQVALLCPTTVLAEQHYRTFAERLGPSGATVRSLSRFVGKKAQTATISGLKQGSVDVVIGTHRLLSKDVHFKNLGLLVVDEEQRFGVTHKERIKELRRHVDVLTLSATPIPRTLSFAISGLRDMSVINTPPADRRAIRTFTSQFDEKLIASVIERELARGGQVYYVKNRIEDIYERAALLQRLVPGVRVAVGHGQMSESALEKTMLGFVDGDYDVLVATAIIESGLDIPRANTMLVERADLFGLSQLYQIRGRVGRSSERAYCYLLVPPPNQLTREAQERIEALERHTELGAGFHIASIDMELRGTGELLGADQSGFVTSVGFDLFSQMLEQATAELSGREYVADVEPELSIDVEALLPESYIDDIGVRLSLYKRFSASRDEDEVRLLAEEMTDRFGDPPEAALAFVEMMRLKTELRHVRALGCTATSKSCTLHLSSDTPLTPDRLVPFISAAKGRYSLSPDGRLTRRSSAEAALDNGLKHADRMLDELARLLPS
jgi:transcription-repair coupling factor (superfamily II helicase)